MEHSQYIQEFTNYLNFEKYFSAHTAKCYGADLLQFAQFVTERDSGEHSDSNLSFDANTNNDTAVATQLQTQVDQMLLKVEVADVRSYRWRWVKSEDNYWGGKYDYPLGYPDINTINYLRIFNGEITDQIFPCVRFGRYQIQGVGKTIREIIEEKK